MMTTDNPKVCDNCCAPIKPGQLFCIECGIKLKSNNKPEAASTRSSKQFKKHSKIQLSSSIHIDDNYGLLTTPQSIPELELKSNKPGSENNNAEYEKPQCRKARSHFTNNRVPEKPKELEQISTKQAQSTKRETTENQTSIQKIYDPTDVFRNHKKNKFQIPKLNLKQALTFVLIAVFGSIAFSILLSSDDIWNSNIKPNKVKVHNSTVNSNEVDFIKAEDQSKEKLSEIDEPVFPSDSGPQAVIRRIKGERIQKNTQNTGDQ